MLHSKAQRENGPPFRCPSPVAGSALIRCALVGQRSLSLVDGSMFTGRQRKTNRVATPAEQKDRILRHFEKHCRASSNDRPHKGDNNHHKGTRLWESRKTPNVKIVTGQGVIPNIGAEG